MLSQKLPLPHGEVVCVVLYHRIIALRHCADEVVDLCHLGSLNYLLARGVGPAVGDIFGNGTRKQPCALLDVGYVVAQLILRHCAYVDAVQEHPALGNVVEAQHQGGNRRFAAARAADYSRSLPAFAGKVKLS